MDVKYEESVKFGFWSITLRLLKMGIPWDFIMEATESQIYLVLGIEAAMNQKENEDNQAQMSSHKMPKMSMPSVGGF